MGESPLKCVHKEFTIQRYASTVIKVNDMECGTMGDEVKEIASVKKSRTTVSSKRKRQFEVYKFLQLSGIFMLLIFLNTCAWVAEKKLYGEECLASEECNEKELLSCGSNGRCNCSPSHSLMFATHLERCVAKVGEKCGSAFRGDLSFSVLCVEGAICDESSGGCVCTDDYFRVINGTCLRKRKFMEVCLHDNECSKDIRNSKPLVCHNGFCKCDPKYQFYDEDRKMCVTLVGSECSVELGRHRNECPRHAHCIDGICICEDHYAKTRSGKCALGHGRSCKGHAECSDYFQCLDGNCHCKFRLHQHFDSKSQECLGLIGGPCTLKFNGTIGEDEDHILQRCTKNAICTDVGFYSSCECMEGFVLHGGKCAPGFGETCDALECDPITPLFCKNGRCDCQDELQYYDPSRRRCLGLVGTICDASKMNECVQFSSCIQVGNELEGKCFCDRYAQEIENRTCIYDEA